MFVSSYMGYARQFDFVTVKKSLFFDCKRTGLINHDFLEEKSWKRSKTPEQNTF